MKVKLSSSVDVRHDPGSVEAAVLVAVAWRPAPEGSAMDLSSVDRPVADSIL